MSPKTMRVLLLNSCVFVVAFTMTAAQSSGDLDPEKKCNFLECNTNLFMDLMKKHFDTSMEYLLTGKQYGSQYVQRPGMAKYLTEASDRHWEEGMDVLEKYFQRGGVISQINFKPAFAVEGNPQLLIQQGGVVNENYVETLKKMLDDSKEFSSKMNDLHHHSGKKQTKGGDAEIGHYLDGKLEKEAQITRNLAGHWNTLRKMDGLGVAVNMFDSNL